MVSLIPDSFFNMTDLLKKSLHEERVVAFPVHEYWVDVGQFEDFNKANAEFDKVFMRGK